MGIRGIRKGSTRQYSLNILSDKATSKKVNPHHESFLLADSKKSFRIMPDNSRFLCFADQGAIITCDVNNNHGN